MVAARIGWWPDAVLLHRPAPHKSVVCGSKNNTDSQRGPYPGAGAFTFVAGWQLLGVERKLYSRKSPNHWFLYAIDKDKQIKSMEWRDHETFILSRRSWLADWKRRLNRISKLDRVGLLLADIV